MEILKQKLKQKTHIIVLSPHLDDGVWSCGGTISLAVKAGCRVDLITVYTGNPTDKILPKIQRKELTENGSMEIRKIEDTNAMKVLNANAIWWDIPSKLYRKPYIEKRIDVFNTPSGDKIMNDDYYMLICKKISQLIENYPNAVLLCPMGVGHMYDHVELFTACIQTGCIKIHLKNMFFYEDSYAILTKPRKVHFLLKNYVWKNSYAPQNTSFWWMMMGFVMSKSATNSDIRTCIPEDLITSEWKHETINIENEFNLKMKSLSEYKTQMKQFGGMKRVEKVFKKYHEYWNNSEPFWSIQF